MGTVRPQAILFDNDGVLIASERLHWQAWENLLGQMGIPYHASEIQPLVGRTSPEIMTQLLDRHHPGWDPKDYPIHELAQQKNDIYLHYARTALQPYPGVKEGLAWLRTQGIKIAVVSNAKRRELLEAHRFLELDQWVDLYVSRDDVTAFKPDPLPYLFAAASLGIDPANCIAVEDSPPGLEAALMARIPTAAVLTNFTRSELEQPVPGRPDLRPIWIGKSIEALMQWIRAHFI